MLVVNKDEKKTTVSPGWFSKSFGAVSYGCIDLLKRSKFLLLFALIEVCFGLVSFAIFFFVPSAAHGSMLGRIFLNPFCSAGLRAVLLLVFCLFRIVAGVLLFWAVLHKLRKCLRVYQWFFAINIVLLIIINLTSVNTWTCNCRFRKGLDGFYQCAVMGFFSPKMMNPYSDPENENETRPSPVKFEHFLPMIIAGQTSEDLNGDGKQSGQDAVNRKKYFPAVGGGAPGGNGAAGTRSAATAMSASIFAKLRDQWTRRPRPPSAQPLGAHRRPCRGVGEMGGLPAKANQGATAPEFEAECDGPDEKNWLDESYTKKPEKKNHESGFQVAQTSFKPGLIPSERIDPSGSTVEVRGEQTTIQAQGEVSGGKLPKTNASVSKDDFVKTLQLLLRNHGLSEGQEKLVLAKLEEKLQNVEFHSGLIETSRVKKLLSDNFSNYSTNDDASRVSYITHATEESNGELPWQYPEEDTSKKKLESSKKDESVEQMESELTELLKDEQHEGGMIERGPYADLKSLGDQVASFISIDSGAERPDEPQRAGSHIYRSPRSINVERVYLEKSHNKHPSSLLEKGGEQSIGSLREGDTQSIMNTHSTISSPSKISPSDNTCACAHKCYAFPPDGRYDMELPYYHMRWCELESTTISSCVQHRIHFVKHENKYYSAELCGAADILSENVFNCHCSGLQIVDAQGIPAPDQCVVGEGTGAAAGSHAVAGINLGAPPNLATSTPQYRPDNSTATTTPQDRPNMAEMQMAPGHRDTNVTQGICHVRNENVCPDTGSGDTMLTSAFACRNENEAALIDSAVPTCLVFSFIYFLSCVFLLFCTPFVLLACYRIFAEEIWWQQVVSLMQGKTIDSRIDDAGSEWTVSTFSEEILLTDDEELIVQGNRHGRQKGPDVSLAGSPDTDKMPRMYEENLDQLNRENQGKAGTAWNPNDIREFDPDDLISADEGSRLNS